MEVFNFMFHISNFLISSNCYVLYECITYYLLLKNCIVGYAREHFLYVYFYELCTFFLLFIRPFIIILVCYNTIGDESPKSPIPPQKKFKIILFVCVFAFKGNSFHNFDM